MTVGTDAVDYSADGGSTFNTYYYVRNAQNDVVKLVDNSGNTVVEYLYDTWGKVLSVSGSLATTLGYDQPFMYRGYVYDKEIGLYYLQSRYYDPTTCRFISADVLLSTGQGVLGNNSFAYCLNDPINRADSSGRISVKGLLELLKELCEGGSGGVHIVGPGIGTSIGSGNGSSGECMTAVSSGASTGACALAGTVGTTAGGIAAQTQGRPEEDSQKTKLMQTNSLDGGGYAKGFRGKLQRLTGIIGEGMEAHHVFPQHFREPFSKIGIDIDDPKYGSWVDAHCHHVFSRAYNVRWKEFFDGAPTQDGAFALAHELAGQYGFDLWFDGR